MKMEHNANLEIVERHQLSIPIYGWQRETTENPMVQLVENIKKMWLMENLEERSINVKVTYDVSVIIMTRKNNKNNVA